ncbi:BREX-1 system adenine-specific DNA-methyltransferase PglX [Enterococcus faecium]|uniref:BREX-1 system adenine-specific DNA-methyltransferase PglX n=1 Tax=Bacteria TaxID=2 RepID=UPI00114442F8|nr:BREX-1 system adenine-specific DNA-methyltransferase PglX [Enterococcus faecium]EGP4990872.1 BREX-1 system adenine-specific DNA-methyltransferase PglX [Enterococcus faecium]EME7106021.1 BREX-1 system adenine-specific DNA-methyltransferase PglX [Enterococcus faecium]MCL6155325.1 BREX-1 system adenine-specific DNA-methyltransferase PglX [Enterococcus faecium]MCL6157196.1 BREX-1 system adenine-specific DNA-methyltransferase PglX [Enterococcus faecium]NTM25362.1 BREX-1 system adenine-specific D
MDKKAIKNFAVNARRKLIDEVMTKAKRLGIDESKIEDVKKIDSNLQEIEKSGIRIQGKEIAQRNKLIAELKQRASVTSYSEAFQELIEEVAYTWFNRLIAIRFMEVNDYLPDTYRVLSSEISGKIEPDIITDIYDADIFEELSSNEQQQVRTWKTDNSAEAMDKLYQLIFIKICNQLNDYLPELFEEVEDYTELLFTASYIKKDGVIADLLSIPEDDFNVQADGQVEIIGWLYQYYNSEPKDQVFARPKSQKVRKQDIPAATQLFTPDWIVRYMVENSLGRFYIEKLLGKGDSRTEKEIAQSFNWEYYLEAAEQPENVVIQLKQEQQEKADYAIENIHFIDPSMGSGHILVYAFEVFMQLYENEGYSTREAASLILEKNLFGLDIDQRAKQLAYFALMMKGREYNRQILRKQITPNVYDVPESKKLQQDQDFLNELKVFFNDVDQYENLIKIIQHFTHGKDYGSLIKISEDFNYTQLIDKVKQFSQEHTEGLFAEDFKQKVTQLINLVIVAKILSSKYEIVVTNPPYMGSSGMDKVLSDFAKKKYPNSKNDLFAMFMERWNHSVVPNGYNTMVTMQSWMFLSSFEKMRKEIVANHTIINMMHMANMVMGIAFGTVVTTLKNKTNSEFNGTYHFVDYKDIENAHPTKSLPISNDRFSISNQENFKKIPGMPIAYWASKSIITAFEKGKPISDYVTPKQGLATADNDKFLRLWWEVDINKIKFDAKTLEDAKKSGKKWFPYNKGGSFRRWYGNYDYIVNWENDGQEIRNFVDQKGKLRSVTRNPNYYFKESITWSDVTSGAFSMRYRPSGSIFDSTGHSAFTENKSDQLYLLGLLNSPIANYIFNILNPTIHMHIGYVSLFPTIINENIRKKVTELVEEAIRLSKNDWIDNEQGWYTFRKNSLLGYFKTIENSIQIRNETLITNISRMRDIEREINTHFISSYGMDKELSIEIEHQPLSLKIVNNKREIKDFISYSIGCIFGRYSLDEDGLIFAGGEWDPSRYQKFKPDADNVLLITDDEYFKDSQIDIVNRFIDFVEITFGKETLEENLQFITDTLGGKGEPKEIIRRYFLKDFYKDHLKTYSNRPIYWQLDSGKQNGFKALMYLHRYTPDQLGKVRTEYLHELQKAYDNRIELRQQQISTSDNQKEINAMTKEIAKIQKQLKEVREYDEKLGHLALKRIELDLDDGVIVNYDKLQRDPKTGEKFQILAKGVKEPKK